MKLKEFAEGMGFLGEKDVEEAANAAHAIAMKKAGNKPKTEGLRDSVGTKKKNGQIMPNRVSGK
jgi:hypothetical protein